MKKVISVLLAVTVMATLFVGCNNTADKDSTSKTTAQAVSYDTVRGGYAAIEKRGTPIGDFLRLELAFTEEPFQHPVDDGEIACDFMFYYELWEECENASDEVLSMETGSPVTIDDVEYYNLVYGIDTTGAGQLIKEENDTLVLRIFSDGESDITFKRAGETKLEVVAVSKPWTPLADSDYSFFNVGDVFEFEPAAE